MAAIKDSAGAVVLGSLGVIAYVAETLLHEAAGHGGLCLLTGGQITLLAPLYMRCSVIALPMVAAGPGMNVFMALACFLLLRIRRAQTGAWRYLLWLSFVFNGLVAAGYLLVGAATGFGDWGVLFGSIRPSWLWRVPAAIFAVVAYGTIVKLASAAFVRLTGFANPTFRTRAELILLPTVAAAVVAVAALLYGQGTDPLGLALALGCTLVVGLSLTLGFDGKKASPDGAKLQIAFNPAWPIAAIVIGAGFVAFVGPGLNLSGL